MARTKKYLTSNRTSTSKTQGFYRPIKRVNSSASSVKKHIPTTPKQTISIAKQDEVLQLEEQIKQAEQLKLELQAKIQKQIKASTESAYQQLDSMIQDAHSKLSQISTPPVPKKDHRPKPTLKIPSQKSEIERQTDFESNYGESSKLTLLEKELSHSQKVSKKHQREVEELKASFDEEKKQLTKTIKNLQQDIKHETPISENKFLTISQELQQVVNAMQTLVDQEHLDKPSPTPTSITQQNTTPKIEASASVEETQETKPNPETSKQTTTQPIPADKPPATPTTQVKSDASIEKKDGKKKFSIPKPVIALGVTILIVAGLGGAAWYFLVGNTSQVDANLVQEYLPEDSAQQLQQPEEKNKDETTPQKEEQEKPSSDASPSGDVQGASTSKADKYSESQANIKFDDTEWADFNSSRLNIKFQYPKNSANLVKTDSSITVIRKTGYIFKVQVVESALSPQEYWKLIQGNSLKYKVSETEFQDKEALFLELEDFSDYPGDKYIVKHGDYIFDIWYATYSTTLSNDDQKRIDVMLNTFEFLE